MTVSLLPGYIFLCFKVRVSLLWHLYHVGAENNGGEAGHNVPLFLSLMFLIIAYSKECNTLSEKFLSVLQRNTELCPFLTEVSKKIPVANLN